MPGELYDLKSDLGEKRNRAAVDPKTADTLQEELNVWMAQMAKHVLYNWRKNIPENTNGTN